MASAHASTVQNMLASFGRGDQEAMVSYYSPDLLVSPPAPLVSDSGGGTFGDRNDQE